MLNGNTNIVTSLNPSDSTILSDECFHMLVELMAAVGAVGHADHERCSDRITLSFTRVPKELKRKARLTGSAIEKFVTAKSMLALDFNAAICKLLAWEASIPDEVGLEILIDADLANAVHTRLLLNVYHGVQMWNGQIDGFLAWLESVAFAGIWYGDDSVSITGVLDMRNIKLKAPQLFSQPALRVKSVRAPNPCLVF